MVVPLWVGCVDPGTAPTGLYVIPRRDLHPLLHDTAADLMTAAQYALGGLQKAGVGALLPPLQANLRLVGVDILYMSQDGSWGPNLQTTGAGRLTCLGAARTLGVAPAAGNESRVKEQANSSTRAG